MQPLSLDKRLDRVGQHIVRARLFLDLWAYFEEEDSRSKIIEVMIKYNEFFRFTPHAYFAAYIIYIAGVFDKSRGTISLISLVREMKLSGHLCGVEAATVEAVLREVAPVAAKVTLLRHNAFAHRSAHMSYDDAFEVAAVKPCELRWLTEVSLSIANKLLVLRGLSEQHFTMLPMQAAEAMMQALDGAKQER